MRGCVWTMPCNEGAGPPSLYLPEYAPFTIAAESGSTYPSWQPTIHGPALRWDGSGFHALEIESYRNVLLDVGASFSFHWIGSIQAIVGTPILWGRPTLNNYWTAVASWTYGQSMYVQYGGSLIYTDISAFLVNPMAQFSMTVTADGTNLVLYVNGAKVTTVSSGTFAGTGPSMFIGYGPLYGNLLGSMASLTQWRRALTESEARCLADEPFAHFAIPQRRAYSLPWVASAKVGVISATLGPVVGAGAARVGQTAVVGGTMGAITGASVGRFGPRGSAAAALGPITGAIAGAFRSQGTISAPLGPIVGAMAAVATIPGSGAIAALLGPIVCSAAGVASAVVAGTINVQLGRIEAALPATVRADGAIAGELGPIVGAAAGLSAANVAGYVTGQLGPITGLASGVVGVRAAVAGQLGPVQCDAAAGVQGTAIGFVAAVLGPIIGGGQINAGGYAAIASQLGPIQCTIAALTEASGEPGPVSSSGADVFRLGPRQRIVTPAPRQRVVALGPRERIARKEPRV
jgi:hypothetical protein